MEAGVINKNTNNEVEGYTIEQSCNNTIEERSSNAVVRTGSMEGYGRRAAD
jgi:hypothetical protein